MGINGIPKRRRPADAKLRFGLFWPYGLTTHVISAALAARNPDWLDMRVQNELAHVAEEIGFDFVFIADSWAAPAGRFGHKNPLYHPCVLGGALFQVTEHIGIVTTMQSIFNQPATVARFGATLDCMSGGRWGWNVVTGTDWDAETLFGVQDLEHDVRYEMAEEMVSAVKTLWASGQDEHVGFQGRYYAFEGSMVDPRPVQEPWPLLVSASMSAFGQGFAARTCDYLFVNMGQEAEQLRMACTRFEDMAVEAGRRPGEVAVLTSPIVVLGDTAAAGRGEWQWILDHLDIDGARRLQASRLARRDPDVRSAALADTERLRALAAGSNHLVFAGSAESVAEEIANLVERTHVGGLLVNLPFWSPGETARFAGVLRRLEDAGVWEHPASHGWSW